MLVLGVLGLIMTFYAPKAFLNFFGYLGTGTLQATLIGPVLVGTFWRGNSYGCIASMLSGCVVASYMLLATDAGWVMGPITGDIVGIVVYVAVSKATFAVQPRVRLAHEVEDNGVLPDAVESKAAA